MNSKTLEKSKIYERNILKEKGFSESDFTVSECYLSEKDYIHYVRIHKKKPTNKNVLLMAHGYMGSNIGFFKLYKTLQDKYHIISIDIPGQGLSSSLEETPKSIEGWLDYFLTNIKRFLDKMEIKKFSICGHSMGAYLMTHFAGKYPEMINDIFLLSPGGVHKNNPDFEKRIKTFIKEALT